VKGETEKMSLEPCSKLTVSEGDSAVSSRQLELWWRSSAFRDYCCSSAWKEQIATLGRAETRTAWIVIDCAGNATEVGRPGASDAVTCDAAVLTSLW